MKSIVKKTDDNSLFALRYVKLRGAAYGWA